MFRVLQLDRAVVLSGMEEDIEGVAVHNLEILVKTVEREPTGPANVELPRSTEIYRRHLESSAGRSTLLLLEGIEQMCTWSSDLMERESTEC